MGAINTGGEGITLSDILKKYDNRDFEEIEVRCLWRDKYDNPNDDLIGFCQYVDGDLIPLDGDTYSFADRYVEWEPNGNRLTVWEKGEYEEWS